MKFTIVSCDSCKWESPPVIPSVADQFRLLGLCAECLKHGKKVSYRYRETDTFYFPNLKGL